MSVHITGKDHVQGDENAPLVLVEYGDYQCPYCGEAYYVIKKAQKELGDKMKFVFRNFPLPQLHQYAVNAAIAAEAASAQGKFWEMHDILYENQKQLDVPHLVSYAKKIGLDITQFEKDLQKDEFMDKVESDYKSGIKDGIQGTPGFLINGELFTGNWMLPEFIDYLKSKAK